MPYCPQCYAEMRESWPRCLLDGQLFRVRRCAGCQAEIFHDERYCQHCGRAASDAPRPQVVALRPAGYVARLMASGLDVACVGYLRLAVAHVLTGLGFILEAPAVSWAITLVLAVSYFAWFEAHGRQTAGDQVLGIAVLAPDREPLPIGRSLLRGVLLLVAVSALVLGACGISALDDPLFWAPPKPLAVLLLVASVVPFLP
ncbi:MAG: RDD family protein, partial [Candidatus Xenobia bacterium]